MQLCGASRHRTISRRSYSPFSRQSRISPKSQREPSASCGGVTRVTFEDVSLRRIARSSSVSTSSRAQTSGCSRAFHSGASSKSLDAFACFKAANRLTRGSNRAGSSTLKWTPKPCSRGSWGVLVLAQSIATSGHSIGLTNGACRFGCYARLTSLAWRPLLAESDRKPAEPEGSRIAPGGPLICPHEPPNTPISPSREFEPGSRGSSHRNHQTFSGETASAAP